MMIKTACFFGNRTINETEELKAVLTKIIEKLIVEEKVDTFLFGSKSRFNSLCQETVTALKEKYPYIKRVYVRAEYPYISEEYKSYLFESYEDTYYPEQIIGAGRACYIKRNYEMIENSSFCVVYYKENSTLGRSGTKIALDYALTGAFKPEPDFGARFFLRILSKYSQIRKYLLRFIPPPPKKPFATKFFALPTEKAFKI